MLLKSSLLLKHARIVKNLRPCRTRYYASSHTLDQIVSTNISLTQLVKEGSLDNARKLFDEMPRRTVVSCNIMISGYSKYGRYGESLRLFSNMHCSNVKLNESTFTSIMSACTRSKVVSEGTQVHCLVLKSGSFSFELVGSSLLHFYSSCFEISEARKVFDELREGNDLVWSLMLVGYVQCNMMNEAKNVFMEMPRRDVVAWTTLISGYSKREEDCTSALELFRLMRECSEVMPNEFTLDCVLRACCRLGVLDIGRSVHGIVTKFGFESDHSIGSALIELYCHSDVIDDARKVSEGTDDPCLSSSNSLIGGLILMDRMKDAELIFSGMSIKDSVSYNLMIKGYAISGRVEASKRLFENMPLRTIISSNTMISVYFRNGEIDKALGLFNEIKEERNPVTWNSMISGYVQNGLCEEALKLYVTMRRLSVDHTRSTFSVLFHACSCIGCLQQGRLIHACLAKTPFKPNVYVGTSLVDMYSKCGSICDAQASFHGIDSPNVAAWTALINGYAHHGLASEAVLAFEHMLKDGVSPNSATFVGILSACACDGLVTTGMRCFYSMEKSYGVTPILEHYACVVDLLGRSGHLREAEDLIQEMPIKADGAIWGALLSACWYWMDMAVGKRVAEKMFTLDPLPVSSYVIMSNIYAGLGWWTEKMEVRKRLRALAVKKDPGCSWIELNDSVHVFCVEDKTHSHNSMICSTLEHLISNVNATLEFGSFTMTENNTKCNMPLSTGASFSCPVLH